MQSAKISSDVYPQDSALHQKRKVTYTILAYPNSKGNNIGTFNKANSVVYQQMKSFGINLNQDKITSQQMLQDGKQDSIQKANKVTNTKKNEEKIKNGSLIVGESDIQSQIQRDSQVQLIQQENRLSQGNEQIITTPSSQKAEIKKSAVATKSILKLPQNNLKTESFTQLDVPRSINGKQQDNSSNIGRIKRLDSPRNIRRMNSPIRNRAKSTGTPLHRNQGDHPIFEWDILKAREIVFPTADEEDNQTEHDNQLSQVFGENASIYNSILDQSKSRHSIGSSNNSNHYESFTTSQRNDANSNASSNSLYSGSSHIKSQSNMNISKQTDATSKQTKNQKKNNQEANKNKEKQTENQKSQNEGDDQNEGNKITQLKEQTIDEFLKETVEYEYSQIVKNQINNIIGKGINKIKYKWSGDEVLECSKINKQTKTISVLLKSLNYTSFTTEQNEGGLLGLFNAFRRRVKMFVNSSLYENAIMISVVINTIILSLDGSIDDQTIFDKFNEAFTYIFAIDMFLKLLGLGVTTYVSDKMNIFDAIIVALSIFDMIFLTGTEGGSSFSAFRSVRILRVFRVLRVTRLLRQLMFMKILIQVISSIMDKLIYIMLLLILYIFIYTLIGMQIYGGQFMDVSRDNRMVFDSFLEASFTVYDILTIENWNTILQVALRTNVSIGITCAYLISCIFIGNFIIMNLVLATMIGAFNSGQFDREKRDIGNTVEIVEDLDLNNTQTHNSLSLSNLSNSQPGSQTRLGNSNSSFSKIKNKNLQTSGNSQENSYTDNNTSNSGSKKKINVSPHNKDQVSLENRERGGSSVSDSQHPSQDNKQNNNQDMETNNQVKQEGEAVVEKNMFKEKKPEDEEKEQAFLFFDNIKCQRSLYIFSMQNRFRKVCYYIVKHPYFESSILFGIVLNSLKLVFDTYIASDASQDSIEKQLSKNFDIVFSIFFALESAIKIISYGFVLDENSYLRDSWSQLDLFVVITSIIDVSYEGVDLGAIKILRLLRTLRPLRILHHNKSMKLIVTTLLESMAGILNMILVLFLVWLMFAILGVSLMKGKLKYCQFPNNGLKYDIYQYDEENCNNLNGTWAVYDMNFDNVLNALITLFIFSTFEGWPVYAWNFIDASTNGPSEYNSSYFAVFIVVFILVGSFFSIDLFGAVLAFHYDIAHKKSKNKYLSDEQAQWIELQRLILKSIPNYSSISSPTNKFRKIIWKICESYYLEIFIMICIIGNIIAMSLSYDTSPQSYDDTLQNINLAFSSVFILECILKLIAYGVNGYFFKQSNQFDFFVVAVSLIDIIFTYTGKSIIKFLSSGPQIARIFRVFRVTRLLRLVKQFEGLQKLMQTLMFALPSLANATALLLLIYFIFSILACFLFSSYESGNSLDAFQNFSTFHRSYLLLFRLSTGEDWHIIMYDVIHKTNGWSAIFFLFFIIVQQFIMMNLFVLIIIQQFEQNYINPDNPLNDFKYSEEDFKKQWVQFTRENFGTKIHERFVTDFYFQTMRPLGFGKIFFLSKLILQGKTKLKVFIEQVKTLNKDVSNQDLDLITGKFRIKQKQIAEKEIMQMNIRCDYDGFIYFNELLYYFFKNSLYSSVFERTERAQTQKELEKCIKSEEILQKEEKVTFKKLRAIKKSQATFTKQKFISKRQKDVNPMVRRLFVGMCFRSWLKFSINIQKNINVINDDISSQSDSDEEVDLQFNPNQLENIQAIDKQYNTKDDENIIQVRNTKSRQYIIPREHTIHERKANNNGENNEVQKRSSTQIETSQANRKYMMIPNAEDIYRQDIIDNNYEQIMDLIQQQQLEEKEKNKKTSRKNTYVFGTSQLLNQSIHSPLQTSNNPNNNSLQNIQPINFTSSQSVQHISKLSNKNNEYEYSETPKHNYKSQSDFLQVRSQHFTAVSNQRESSDLNKNVPSIVEIQNSPRLEIHHVTEYEGSQKSITPTSNLNRLLTPKQNNIPNYLSHLQATPITFSNHINSRNFLSSIDQSRIHNDTNNDIENKLGSSLGSIKPDLKFDLTPSINSEINCSPKSLDSIQNIQYSPSQLISKPDVDEIKEDYIDLRNIQKKPSQEKRNSIVISNNSSNFNNNNSQMLNNNIQNKDQNIIPKIQINNQDDEDN